MANFLLLCAHISVVLLFIDVAETAILPVNNQGKEEVAPINNSSHPGSTHSCFNKTNCNKTVQHITISNCIYDHNWPKHGNTIQKYDNCSYKQRSKTTAVLISIYFGVFGADWFYLSRGNSVYIIVGICKLLISCGCCSGWPILTFGARRASNLMIIIGYILSVLFSLISLLWWVIDWARILANKFSDGNGIELKHFSEYF